MSSSPAREPTPRHQPSISSCRQIQVRSRRRVQVPARHLRPQRAKSWYAAGPPCSLSAALNPVKACSSTEKSLEIRSLTSPCAVATTYGRVLDQDGAVIASVRRVSISSCGTGVGRKSRVVRLEATKSLKDSALNLGTLEIYAKNQDLSCSQPAL